ncbi:L,D-transpeptidase [Aureimonas glaciei]|jgi:lipoprotein-anchoring transpeptidase ErfK/SrfK|uniref:L,D-transpeptidase n=1 Tax=Aureimonas glaciei TaxID=1776957 RepID=A0A916XVM8_9HYPH|nr:L,D-transpeptidase [Aureimonas glaciei]GGD16343.1 L,D-transpeptidase [Aureimonas glaciei]
MNSIGKVAARRAAAGMAFGAIGFGLFLGAAAAREPVGFDSAGALPGTIVIRTTERRLYLVLGEGRALSYPVGVGRADRQWTGLSAITGKYVRPNWAPPAAVKRDRPSLPDMIPGGAPNNPMGVAAMTLAGGEYAIHGTNSPKSIGGFVSYGCIRMFNEDIIHLYDRVRVGTPVLVTR